nr:hypothetical protein BaRGS_002860 [Batillaria attramentaria]
MLMMKPFGRYTVDQVSELLSDLHVQYGPIVRARMGRHWIVYVERLEDIERTFRAEGACPKRPLLNLHKVDDLESRPAQYKLLQCFKTNLHCTGAAMMGREFTYLFYRDKFYKNFERATNHIMSFISDFLHEAQNELSRREREGTGDTGDTNLVLSLLSEPTMDIPRVMGIIEPLLTAGSDSTASSLQMLLYHLARHPDKQQLLADHLRQEMGDGQPLTADTLSNLKYLAACVKESLRLSFPLPSGVARILPADLVLSGYLVPKGLIHKLHVSLPAGYDGKLETEYRPFVTPKHPLPFIFTPRH